MGGLDGGGRDASGSENRRTGASGHHRTGARATPASASPSRAQLHLEADELVLEEVVDLVLVEPVDTTLEEIYLDEAVKVSAQPARGALPSQQSVASKHSSTSKPVSVSKTAAAKQLTPPAVALRAGLSMPSPEIHSGHSP